MKKRKFLATFIAGTLALSMSVSATAATWEDVDDFEKLSNAFQDMESEVNIILSGNITNENSEILYTNIGQNYIINGQSYTLTDVHLNGEGNVVINSNINSSEENDAINTYDNVNVTVNGDIHAYEDGVNANDQSTIVINGDVFSVHEDGIDADDEAHVTVNGDVYGGAGADGVDASDDTVIIVNGDVYGGDGQAPDENGNLSEGNMSDPDGYSDGGSGIEADKNAQVTVDGNVYGGDAYGTYGIAGSGIEAMDTVKVEVSGNVQGGDQIADPNVAPNTINEGADDAYTTAGYAGDGVYMSGTADVTVGGDAIGGAASGQDAAAGCGAYIELTFTAKPSRDPETGETVANKKTPGQLTVRGIIIGGDSTGKNGEDGTAVFYGQPYDMETGEYLDNPIEKDMIPEEFIEQICSDDNLDYVRMCITNAMPGMISDAGMYYVDHEGRLVYQEEYKQAVKKLAEEYGVDIEKYDDIKDIVDAVPEEKVQEFAKKALNLGNDTLRKMALEAYAVPMVTAGALQVEGDGNLILAMTDETTKYFAANYVDVEGIEDTKAPVSSDALSDETPKTGDASMTGVMSSILIVSAIVFLGAGIWMRRK